MLHSEGELSNLYFVTDKHFVEPHIRVALEQAEQYKADAVFFRIFPDGDNRFPIPQIYIYHDCSLSFDEAIYAGLHRKLWNAGIIPLIFIITAGQVKIINCRQEPTIDKSSKEPIFTPFHALEKMVSVDQTFIAREIAAGTFWEDPDFKNDFILENTAYYKLLTHLKTFRKELFKQGGLTEPTINRILVMAIMVKYLNDRQDSKGNRVFVKGFFSQFSRTKDDRIESVFWEKGSCIKLFDNLSRHLNGGIFVLSDNEKEELRQADLSPIADFLEGDIEPDGQKLFWPLYSFEDLPVELISNIYEEFLAKKDTENSKGVVYTPPMLVDFLIDQCLPLDTKTLSWKILDPACGSGVFLVGAFKRLIQCWRLANDWKQPTYIDLQLLLKNNIFGIDKASEAVLVTAFSLCVALCDELEPLIIWNELKFDNLQDSNLQSRDFFDVIESGEFNEYFDLVIGNPPFESTLNTEAAIRVNNARIAEKRPNLPDTQVALLFLEHSFRLVRKDAVVCLIQPAGPLLYNGNSLRFRNYIFNQFALSQIFDFTPLEGSLFKAKVASAAIIGFNRLSTTNKISHLTFRRTKAIKEKLLFELDPYDFHWVSLKDIIQKPYIWKVNLLGGGRLHRVIDRLLLDTPTLGTYLEQKKKNDGWQFGEGYSVGCGKELNDLPNVNELTRFSPEELKQQFKFKMAPKIAPWITGECQVPPKKLTKMGIDWMSVKPVKKIFFERPRGTTKLIFSPPHVLIREKVEGTSIPAAFTKKKLVFTNQVIGIYAPENEQEHLKVLAERLNESKLFGILAIMISGRILVGRSNSLYKSDIMALPYPDDMQDFELNFWEQALVDDIDNYLVDFRRKGENAIVLSKTNEADLHSFGKMYCNILNPVYKEFCPLDPIPLGSFICYPFCYGDTPKFDIPDKSNIILFLEKLLRRQKGRRLFINRILRLYEQNIIFMVKPNQKRYWTNSIALRDADETLVDFLHQGY